MNHSEKAPAYKYGRLTEEILSILPENQPSMWQLLMGHEPWAKRIRQIQAAYGDIAGHALVEAGTIKYPNP